MRPSRWTRLAAVVLVSPLGAAHAVTVPPAVYRLFPTAVSSAVDGPGLQSGTFCQRGFCAASFASATEGRVLTAGGASAGSDNNGVNANAVAEMTFYFAVEGPANTAVPVDITGFISASASGPSTWAIAEIFYGQQSITRPGGVSFNTCSSDALSVCQLFNVNLANSSTGPIERTLNASYSVLSNTVYNVFLRVGGNSSPAGGPGGVFEVFLDPEINISPAFLAANPQFSIVGSPNMSDIRFRSAVVPVPATAWLTLTAVGALGAMRQRRRASRAREDGAGGPDAGREARL